MKEEHNKIGFIGQGWIGKNYADEFEERLYPVVRYALEEPYLQNKDALLDCTVVFIAVPTPTTPEGFQVEAVESALQLLSEGTTVVIKSTIIPGTTEQLQEKFPHLYIMHSPEFLAEKTVVEDTRFPKRNIVGIPLDTDAYRTRAQQVLNLLPNAPFEAIMPAKEAELVKYAGNTFLYTKVVFMNALHDLVTATGADYETIRLALAADPRIGASHTEPIHRSGHDADNPNPVRGAGGHCFIKDFEAMRQLHEAAIGTDEAHDVLLALIAYNNKLLVSSNKDIDILTDVYGAAEIRKHRND